MPHVMGHTGVLPRRRPMPRQGFQQPQPQQGFQTPPRQQNFSQLAAAIGESPEVRLIRERTARRASEAEARGKGEAQRRGFVSGTGTSDIEFALRRSAVSPIEEAGALAEAGVISRGVEAERGRQFQTGERLGAQEFRTGERIGGQRFRTGERVGGQQFQTGERVGGQEFRTGERIGGQEFRTGERVGGQEFLSGERGIEREFIRGESALDRAARIASAKAGRPRKRKWYEGALEGLAGGVGTGIGMGLFSDKNLKENIADSTLPISILDSMKVKEYNFKGDNSVQHGLIAQELQEVMPEAVVQEGEYLKIDYAKIVPLLIKAIQQLREAPHAKSLL